MKDIGPPVKVSLEFKRYIRQAVLEIRYKGWHWERPALKTAEIRFETLEHWNRFKISEFPELLTVKLLWLLLSAVTFSALREEKHTVQALQDLFLSAHCSSYNYEMWSQTALPLASSMNWVNILNHPESVSWSVSSFPCRNITSVVNRCCG